MQVKNNNSISISCPKNSKIPYFTTRFLTIPIQLGYDINFGLHLAIRRNSIQSLIGTEKTREVMPKALVFLSVSYTRALALLDHTNKDGHQ